MSRLASSRAGAAAVAAAAALLFVVALARWGFRCDESCVDRQAAPYRPGLAWESYDSAWQWDAQLACALAGLAGALAMLVAAFRGRPRAAVRAGAVAAVGYAAWAAWWL